MYYGQYPGYYSNQQSGKKSKNSGSEMKVYTSGGYNQQKAPQKSSGCGCGSKLPKR
ncbi:hypothetical protein [Priestia koreensis]|uniref:hypothetical protein n=1 Tax=Priestia koreensis TaxID=284581 RepID=UPI000B0DCB46|nr:hypothetical protein [Priestia koreensis]